MKLAQLFKQSSIYLVGDVIRRGVGFLMIPVYTHYLSVADYGFIELLELSLMIAGVCFGIAAIGDGMVRIYHDYPDNASRSGVISTAITGSALLGLIIVVLASLGAVPLSRWLAGTAQYAPIIRAAFVAMMFSAVADIALIYQRIRMRAMFFVVFSVTQLLANLGLNVYLIVWKGMGVWGFVLAKLIAAGLSAVGLLALVYREAGWQFRLAAAKRILRFAGPLVFSGGAVFIIHFSDRFFLRHFTSLTVVGVYALAYKCGFLVTYLVGQPFESVWGVSLYAEVRTDQWRQRFARVATYVTFCLLSMTVLLGVFGDKALSMAAPPAYASAALLVPVIAFAYAFREVGDFFRGLLFINKQVRNFGKITIACAVLNLVLNATLISRFQAAGAAWATLLTWGAYMLACWILAQNSIGIPYPWKGFATLCVLAALACVAALFVRRLPVVWEWIGDFGIVGLFASLTWSLGYFSVEERECIRRHLAFGRHTLADAVEHLR